jgi:hypothetical protein
MRHLLRNKNFWLIVGIDVGVVCASYVLAYLIRFEGSPPQEQLALLRQTLPWIVP